MTDTDATPKEANAPGLVAVRATINLPGLRAGEVALVDPTLPYIEDCLRAQFVVPLPADQQPAK